MLTLKLQAKDYELTLLPHKSKSDPFPKHLDSLVKMSNDLCSLLFIRLNYDEMFYKKKSFMTMMFRDFYY